MKKNESPSLFALPKVKPPASTAAAHGTVVASSTKANNPIPEDPIPPVRPPLSPRWWESRDVLNLQRQFNMADHMKRTYEADGDLVPLDLLITDYVTDAADAETLIDETLSPLFATLYSQSLHRSNKQDTEYLKLLKNRVDILGSDDHLVFDGGDLNTVLDDLCDRLEESLVDLVQEDSLKEKIQATIEQHVLTQEAKLKGLQF